MKRTFQKIILIFAIAFSPAAEAKNYAWSAEQHQGDVLQYKDGRPLLMRDKGSYYVAVMPMTDDFYGKPIFAVIIGNRSAGTFNFGIENVSISFDNQTEDTKVLSRQELISQVKDKAGLAAFATGLLGGSTTSRTTVTTPYGTYNSRTSNPSEDYSRIDSASASVINFINTRVYITNTMESGNQYEGLIITSKPKVRRTPSIANISIRVFGNTEEFQITMNQKK